MSASSTTCLAEALPPLAQTWEAKQQLEGLRLAEVGPAGAEVAALPAQRADQALRAPPGCIASMALVVNAAAMPIARWAIYCAAIPRAVAACSVWSLRIARVTSAVTPPPVTVCELVAPTCHVLKTRMAATRSAWFATRAMKTTSVKHRCSAAFAPSTAEAACSAEAAWAASFLNAVTT